MAEEFQESEVIFPESGGNEENEHFNHLGYSNSSSMEFGANKLKRKKKKNNSQKKKISAPVSIPENRAGDTWFRYVETELFDEDDDGGEVIPPHVILGRRISGKMAFSVCSGNGRTLKGRDLSQVRNSILRMTGFLET
ncbi:hypothetical protein LguiA_014839 [Lonicera macranthoides]